MGAQNKETMLDTAKTNQKQTSTTIHVNYTPSQNQNTEKYTTDMTRENTTTTELLLLDTKMNHKHCTIQYKISI